MFTMLRIGKKPKKYNQVEVSFTRRWDTSLQGKFVPLHIDKRFVVLRGCSGFYTYAIYEHREGWPDFDMAETRVAFKLRKDKFHYMAIGDDRQRIMPMLEDRLPPRGRQLAYQEAVLLLDPTNKDLKGEVDDKYQYSCEDKDIRVHGWICSKPHAGFWQITPTDEFRTGGPVKQELTSHVGPTTLAIAAKDLDQILSKINAHILPFDNEDPPSITIAGGSVANTIRGMVAGFGVSSGMITACGDDDQGRLFIHSMSFSGVDLSRLRIKNGSTGQCACLVDADGNRTMRPCLSSAVKLQADELNREDFRGAKWLVLRYAFMNLEQIKTAIRIAKTEGVSVSMDLASFEMVRDYRSHLIDLLKSGNIDLCFANEDEARELISGEPRVDPESALSFLAKHCEWAVVTLGSRGCIAMHRNEVVRLQAITDLHAVDATGAGDLFASGFLYGLVKGLPLEDCCKVGSCSGGSVVRSLGGEVRPQNWQWMYKQMQAKGLLLPHLKN